MQDFNGSLCVFVTSSIEPVNPTFRLLVILNCVWRGENYLSFDYRLMTLLFFFLEVIDFHALKLTGCNG